VINLPHEFIGHSSKRHHNIAFTSEVLMMGRDTAHCIDAVAPRCGHITGA
jgi:hypothetical protein